MVKHEDTLSVAEMQARLARFETIAQLNAALSQASDVSSILNALTSLIDRYKTRQLMLAFSELDTTGRLYALDLIAVRDPNRTIVEHDHLTETLFWDAKSFPLIESIANKPNEIIVIENTGDDSRTNSSAARELMELWKIRALIAVPLKTGTGWQGVLLFAWDSQQQFDLDIMIILAAVQPTAAAVVATRRLLENLETIVEKRTHALQDASETIRQNEMLFQSLVNVLPQAIFRTDTKHRFTFANKNFADTLGLAIDEVIGRSMFEFYPKVLADKYAADNDWVIHTGQVFEDIEEHVLPINGEKIFVQVWKIPLYDHDGQPDGIQGIFWDVTAAKRSEDALRRQREFLRLVIDLNPNFVFAKDTEGRFTLVNQAFADHHGLTVEEMLGKHEDELNYLTGDADYFLETDQQVIDGKQSLLIPEYEMTTLAGEQLWLTTTKIPIFDESGEVAQVLAISIDITEQKQAVVEREQLLHREQQAKQEALEAVRMKDMFLATMSHELRTPLNATIGFQHLILMSGKLDADTTHMLERSLANSQRLLSLINNVLDISRMASGGMKLVAAKFSPHQMARNLHEDLKLAAKDKNISFRVEVEPGVPESIIHDEERLTQIGLNLLSNAIKFTDHGFVTMTMKRKADRLIIKVVDTGIGIPPSRQHVIFDDFVQLDGSSTRKHQGAGLGLSIVKRLLLMMKGTIKLTSEVGKGSIFTVDVPLELPVDI